ncbi:MAG: hypothetical protein JO356_07610, partial [Acidobacteria bacterium]|nr:hypothetical protein [Acidobacteriota bacterium]
LLVLFIIGTASAIYVAYWVRHKVSTYTSAVTGNGEVTVVGSGNSCRLLSTSELANVLGVTIEKSSEVFEGSEPGCAYYTNTEGFAQLQRAAAELARQQAQQANGQQSGKIDNPLEILKNTNQLEGLVKSFGLSQPDKDGKVFSFTVNRHFGRRNWSPLRTTLSVVPGFEDLPDLGDRAMLGSMGHSIFVLKGDTMVSLELTYVPDARRRGAQLGNSIVARL